MSVRAFKTLWVQYRSNKLHNAFSLTNWLEEQVNKRLLMQCLMECWWSVAQRLPRATVKICTYMARCSVSETRLLRPVLFQDTPSTLICALMLHVHDRHENQTPTQSWDLEIDLDSEEHTGCLEAKETWLHLRLMSAHEPTYVSSEQAAECSYRCELVNFIRVATYWLQPVLPDQDVNRVAIGLFLALVA